MSKSLAKLQKEMDKLECFVCYKRYKTGGRWRRHLAEAHHVDDQGNDLTGDQLAAILTPKRLRSRTKVATIVHPLNEPDSSDVEIIEEYPPSGEMVVLDEASVSSSDFEIELQEDEIVSDKEEQEPEVREDIMGAEQKQEEKSDKEEKKEKDRKDTEQKKEDMSEELMCIRKKTRPTPLSKLLPVFRLPKPQIRRVGTADWNPRARRTLTTRESLLAGLKGKGMGNPEVAADKLAADHEWTTVEKKEFLHRMKDLRRGQADAASTIRALIPIERDPESLQAFLKDVDTATKEMLRHSPEDD
jgi:hypothetical protein